MSLRVLAVSALLVSLAACGSGESADGPLTVDGRFVVEQASSTVLVVKMQLRTSTGADDMGGATIVTAFDPAVLSFPAAPARGTDYAFHAFSDEPYFPGTVTRPQEGALWVNIVLPVEASDQGQVVAGPEAWTDVVTLTFGVVDPSSPASVLWEPESMFWGIYDGDNVTLWTPGTFEDLTGVALGG